ncbi:MAG: Gfo/Idh/MocA family protein [Bacillota bacterium]|uniref:Gfo/Idh/MocA family oxidoreductase n=1 Tax=Virgibacillus salarius TaxID=447199 RepID=A0A941IAU7_9BACI|nr:MULTISPECIES: Gfo/Idh/MocA family oxidoreductase [Bacillaceae]NAZ08450.1 Gfo/Idh/MocA family oxidoreductase [Agaribacter marinus]MBR7795737.1 Gfo/Idh/MocA family oxidoreductase [Virgibacillus salarius]MCC2248623.1 Gfo/Idh/MocA family oxidoreductase [Virgibacillus sp. AGTR]MDY7043173.1 Gfo/Idh/MocA family oxidoreductase [Virgibacillus sp. M23]QRZ18378.1 Gfo/Idh/MocA family oxidoreductase [Virgibacillus sp. AGTR]
MRKIKAVLIGAGDRGAKAYAPYAINYPHELDIVAVAELNKDKRKSIADTHHISEDKCFSSWEELLEANIEADVAFICTLDRQHFKPTIKAIEKGYHILLEKPMSPDPAECIEMERKARQHNRLLTICHVLRYTNFWSTIKRVIDEGTIGDIASIQLNENVEIMHMSHSFVRGNWNNSNHSSPMILQKSCHDMDILMYLMDQPCKHISSFGSLMHFHEGNKPHGAPERCLDGCPVENECPFHAGNYYLGEGKGWAKKFTTDHTREGIIRALETTPYGKCVYQSDNNVVDHQVVNLEFVNGATATFSMSAFTREQTRIVQIMGTKGEIRGKMDENKISIYDFLSKHETVIHLSKPVSGHGGGDEGIVRDFLREVRSFDGEINISKTSATKSLESHLIAFAAEASRLENGKVILLEHFLKENRKPSLSQ